MSRTGLYWEDRAGQLCCAHGVILYGANCVRCERGDFPAAYGVDLATGPDQVAYVKARVGAGGAFTIEEVLNGAEARAAINGDDAKMKAMHERISAATRKIAEEIAERARRGEGWGGPYDTGKRWEHSRGDPRARQTHWHVPHPRAPEIITDPNDTRGVNARRVGPRA